MGLRFLTSVVFGICFGFLISVSVLAAETDNYFYAKMAATKGPFFSGRIVDATKATNQVINGYLQLLSTKVENCNDRQEILQKAKFIFDTNFPDINNDLIDALNDNDKFSLLFTYQKLTEKNIYSGFKTPSYDGCCVPVVKVDKSLVGLDKIDHFLSNGFMYFKEYSEKTKYEDIAAGRYKRPVKVLRTDSEEAKTADAINLGKFQEESSWGLSGTGVKSYGDMAANFAGLQFYKNLIDGDHPYLKCVNNKLVQQKEFNIQDYADDSWDESINCSSYDTEENKKIVDKNIKKLGFDGCPIDFSKCEALIKKYKDDAKFILHPKCLDKNSTHSQIEVAHPNALKSLKFLEFRDVERGLKGAK